MTHRSSGPEKLRTKQRNDIWTNERQSKLCGEKREALPAIRPRYGTSMTGKTGIPSSPRLTRAPLPSSKYYISESDKSKAGRRTPSRDVPPWESHTAGHNQQLGSTRHLTSVNRSGSSDPKSTGSKHRRSSSLSGMSSSVQESSRPPPASETRHAKAKPTGSRYGVWTGGGSDVIAHRDPSSPNVSRKKESTYKESKSCGALVHSALNSYTAQQETLSSSSSQGRTPQWFDGSPAQSQRYDTEHPTSHFYNVNNNSNAGRSPPCIPRSSSNGENPQSYPLTSTTYHGLSGGGAKHSKQKLYTANGSVGNGIQSDSLYWPRGSVGSSGTLAPHKVSACVLFLPQCPSNACSCLTIHAHVP